MTERINLCRNPYPLGAHKEEGGIRFSFVSGERDCGILIYDRKTRKSIKKLAFEQQERVGDVWCKFLTGFDASEIAYQFYEGDRTVPDRYAGMYAVKSAYGKEYRESELLAVISDGAFDWEGDRCPRVPYSESICYCAHVRGFTKHKSSGVVHRGTFAGMAEKIAYLKQIGVTTVELQPAYEFAEIPTPEERMRTAGGYHIPYEEINMEPGGKTSGKCNYWGYKRGYYYAPKAGYAAGGDAALEFKQMVKEFHQNGLEIVMQFYFPPEVKVLDIPDILRFWVMEYHVDGFHLMGERIPVDIIAADPMLSETKLWYYGFDTDSLYGREEQPAWKNLAVYRDDYLYTMRRFLKGDEGMLGGVMEQMRQIPEKTGRIHYMSNYYGLTLKDMVCYDRKHNEANGEDNRDGNDYNCSWNCGEEGTSRRKKILALRNRQLKNAMVMLLFSQSTPLIFMGDEFGNSQKGNNNPYCQDNRVAWLDWDDIEKNREIFDFWKQMVEMRKAHPILHPDRELRIMDYICCGYPDLSYHGQNAWRPRTEPYNRQIGIMFCGKYARVNRVEEDNFFYLAMNMYWEKQELALPKLPKGLKWELYLGTFGGESGEISVEGMASVPERSISIYISAPDGLQSEKKSRRREKSRRTTNDYSDRTVF